MFAIGSIVLPWWVVILLAAFIVLAVIDASKRGKLSKLPGWCWTIVSIVLCFSLAALVVFTESKVVVFVFVGLLILSAAQLIGYKGLGQLLVGWLTQGQSAARKEGGDAPPAG